jgi:hypothetical protein
VCSHGCLLALLSKSASGPRMRPFSPHPRALLIAPPPIAALFHSHRHKHHGACPKSFVGEKPSFRKVGRCGSMRPRCCWTITMQVRELNSGGAKREVREQTSQGRLGARQWPSRPRSQGDWIVARSHSRLARSTLMLPAIAKTVAAPGRVARAKAIASRCLSRECVRLQRGGRYGSKFC